MSTRALAATAGALLVALAAPAAFAQVVIEGRITDPSGAGIPDADLDFFESQSGYKVDPSAPGWESQSDKTDVFGYYSLVVVPEVYDVRFEPPEDRIDLAPVIERTLILGTDMELDVTLPAGSRLTGRAVDGSGAPVALVDLDFHDPRGGGRLASVRDDSDGDGLFGTTILPGVWDVYFNPPLGSPTGPLRVDGVDLRGDAVLDVTLPRGHTVTGTVVRIDGPPIVQADLDFDDPDGNRRIPTADDATATNGTFTVNVSEGRRNIFIVPPRGLPYAPTALYDVDIDGDLDLGTIALEHGVVLQGTVKDANGAPVEGADVDLLLPGGCDRYPGTAGGTAADGTFTLRMEPGSYEVVVTPPDGSPLPAHRFAAVALAADAAMDFTLPATGDAAESGSGLVLDADGAPVTGAEVRGEPLAGGAAWSAFTLADGSFTFDASPGRYSITITPAAGAALATLVLDGIDLPCGMPSTVRLRAAEPVIAAAGPSRAVFAFPNPWVATTSLDLTLPAPSPDASVTIYDILGRRVRDLHRGALPEGRVVLDWNGRDGNGRPVTSGVYFVRVVTSSTRLTTKLVKL